MMSFSPSVQKRLVARQNGRVFEQVNVEVDRTVDDSQQMRKVGGQFDPERPSHDRLATLGLVVELKGEMALEMVF